MKRYLVFTCFLSIRQIVLKFVPEYDKELDKKFNGFSNYTDQRSRMR